jgi:hypothetical protein
MVKQYEWIAGDIVEYLLVYIYILCAYITSEKTYCFTNMDALAGIESNGMICYTVYWGHSGREKKNIYNTHLI